MIKYRKNLIPDLDDMSGEWLTPDKLAHFPSVHNFHGTLLVNKDMASISWLVNVPFSQGFHSGTVYIDGQIPLADEFRWFPYQAMRRTKAGDISIESTVRMVFEEKGVLFRIVFRNNGTETRNLGVKTDHVGIIVKYKSPLDWDWFYRLPGYPEDNGSRGTAWKAILDTEKVRDDIRAVPDTGFNCTASVEKGNVLLISEKDSGAYTAFSFQGKPENVIPLANQGYAVWKLQLEPGEEKAVGYVMSYGDSRSEVLSLARKRASRFGKVFDEARALWQKRFNDAFTPGNKHYSGSLPVLETDDSRIRRMYYISVITLLMLERTNLPVLDRVYLTGSPRLGASIMFYWDTSMLSVVFALLDPVVMKQCLRNWLKLDIDSYFGQDMLGGRGVGNMYSASRMNIFKMIYTYVSVTGDHDFLNEKIFSLASGCFYSEMAELPGVKKEESKPDGIPIISHLERLSLAWKKQVAPGDTLADYGEAVNLLECVPTYIHKVPSFNAANVWMMRNSAYLYEKTGEHEKARYLREEADKLVKAVLELYAAGQGVWHSLHRNGDKVEMRHCYDFIAVGKFLTNDLSPEMKREMISFVENELLTKSWMRAQSLKDPAADCSDRADHGPFGAYDGWPAQTVDVFGLFGAWDKALGLLLRCEDVTREGNFSQARELYGPDSKNFNADVRIASRDLVNRDSTGGVAFANAVLQTIFGFNPRPFETSGFLYKPEMNRGFRGRLINLFYDKKYYTVTSGEKGLTIEFKNKGQRA